MRVSPSCLYADTNTNTDKVRPATLHKMVRGVTGMSLEWWNHATHHVVKQNVSHFFTGQETQNTSTEKSRSFVLPVREALPKVQGRELCTSMASI